MMSYNSHNHNNHQNNDIVFSPDELGSSPPKKKRKKNNQCNLLLFKDFSYRCHLQNNILPTVYRAAKYNIKNLCPLHDMLPVITEMERDPFKHSQESHFKGVRYTLRNGYLQNNNSNSQNASSIHNIMQPPHTDINNINNLSLWVCTGNKAECTQFRQTLFHQTHSNVDGKSEIGVIEIPLNLNNVLLPFMNSLASGSQNTNLYLNVKIDANANHNQLSLHYLPLDSLTIQNQINTKRLSFKVLSCGTFKRNLQPMPDACRITKVVDGQCGFTCIDDEHHIGLKITTKKVADRKKLQGSDSILGTGFDCSSRCSWRKPRIYWVSKSIGYVRDPLNGTGSNKVQKKTFTNQDIRISLLWPKHMAGKVDFYLGGMVSSYVENINVSTYKMSSHCTVVDSNPVTVMPSPNQTPNPPDKPMHDTPNDGKTWHIISNETKDIIASNSTLDNKNVSNAITDSVPSNTMNAVNFNVQRLDLPQMPPTLQINPMQNLPPSALIYPMPPHTQKGIQHQNNGNTFNLFATPPNVTNNFASNSSTNSGSTSTMGTMGTANNNYNYNTNGVALGSSALSVDSVSFSILTDVERDLITGRLNHPTAIHKLNVQAPYVLDALSQLLMFCIKHELQEVHCSYYVTILNHIARALSEDCAVDGFVKCWINMETEDTVTVAVPIANNMNQDKKENLCSFMHLVTRYNRINLMKQTMNLFPRHHKQLVNAFVDIRTTLYNESSLIIAIKQQYSQMIELMLDGIWRANGMNSPIIMNNIIASPFNDRGVTIWAALTSFKLFSVLQFLLNINCKSSTKFLSPHNIELMNNMQLQQTPMHLNMYNV